MSSPYGQKRPVNSSSPEPEGSSVWVSLQKMMQGNSGYQAPTNPYMYGDVPDDGKRYDRVDKEKARAFIKGFNK